MFILPHFMGPTKSQLDWIQWVEKGGVAKSHVTEGYAYKEELGLVTISIVYYNLLKVLIIPKIYYILPMKLHMSL